MSCRVDRSSAFLIVALLSGPACAQSRATPEHAALIERGAHIARTVCAYCHWVAKDQQTPPRLVQRTPDFVDIANRPNTSAKTLRRFIATTHWDEKSAPVTMPTPMLTEDDVQAVSRYILSLRTRKGATRG